jgi:hypothetical protein
MITGITLSEDKNKNSLPYVVFFQFQTKSKYFFIDDEDET